ncbi:MAG TPA: AAA family ATPase [Gemmataceae bacterium]|nr:AAA family ATPase [Gemmataceae bacterium]
MIRSVEIKGLRGIREGKLADMTPLVVLVGPNGSGKSTILDALSIGASPTPAEAVGQAVSRRVELSQGARWLCWKAGTDGPARVEISTDAPATRVIELSVGRSHEAPYPLLNGRVLHKSEQNGYHFAVHFRDATRPFDAPDLVKPLDGVSEVRFVDQRARVLQVPLHQLYTQAFVSGRVAETQDMMKALMPAIEDVRILVEGDSPHIYLTYPDRAVPAAVAGDGLFHLLRLSLELTTRRGGSVLLEEPEVRLHPGGIRECARAILAAVRRDIQVILTTHSIELIDSLLSESTLKGRADLDKLSAYGVALKNGVLITTRYSGADVESARGAIQEDLR